MQIVSSRGSLEEAVCMKLQILFSGKNKKNILLYAESAQSMLSVKHISMIHLWATLVVMTSIHWLSISESLK